jgi:hypothetical protein
MASALKNFDPKLAYPAYDGMTRIPHEEHITQVFAMLSLITCMFENAAGYTEFSRAIRHSLVLLDAEKHNLDVKQSAIDNSILQLAIKYQEVSK